MSEDSIIFRPKGGYRHVVGPDCRVKVDRIRGDRLREHPQWRRGYTCDVGCIATCEDCGRPWLCVKVGTEAWWRPISARRARRIMRRAERL